MKNEQKNRQSDDSKKNQSQGRKGTNPSERIIANRNDDGKGTKMPGRETRTPVAGKQRDAGNKKTGSSKNL